MSDQKKKKIRLICSIALSVMLVSVGVLLAVACVNIYNIGNRPFTPENISAEFAKIAVPVFITLGAIIVGGILTLIFPDDAAKPHAIKDKKLTLSLLIGKLDTNTADPDIIMNIEKEKRLCLWLNVGAALLSVASAVPALVYSLNFANFSADYNASVVAACAWVLPCSFIAMGIYVARIYIVGASVERQISLVKEALKKSGASTAQKTQEKPEIDKRIMLGIRAAIAVLAIAFIVVGIFNGGMADVLSKAINICTECIGLG